MQKGPVNIHRTIRSRRRTLTILVTDEGSLVVRAPLKMSESSIRRFVEAKTPWIEKHVRQAMERSMTRPPDLTPAEEVRLKDLARDAFIERACRYARQMDVAFQKIRLNSAKTRWGSCSPRGNLSFNWRLIRAPVEVLDYVVVHELAHLIELNHSRRFWKKVGEFCPGYEDARAWLRKNRL